MPKLNIYYLHSNYEQIILIKISCWSKIATVISSKMSYKFRFIIFISMQNQHQHTPLLGSKQVLFDSVHYHCVLRCTPHDVLGDSLAPQNPPVESACGHLGRPAPLLSPTVA